MSQEIDEVAVKERLQKCADVFNEKYFKLVGGAHNMTEEEVSNAMWATTLIGRQMINHLRALGVIEDNFKVLLDTTDCKQGESNEV